MPDHKCCEQSLCRIRLLQEVFFVACVHVGAFGERDKIDRYVTSRRTNKRLTHNAVYL